MQHFPFLLARRHMHHPCVVLRLPVPEIAALPSTSKPKCSIPQREEQNPESKPCKQTKQSQGVSNASRLPSNAAF